MLFYQNLSIPLFNQKVSLEGRFSVKAHACPTRSHTGGGRWMAARASWRWAWRCHGASTLHWDQAGRGACAGPWREERLSPSSIWPHVRHKQEPSREEKRALCRHCTFPNISPQSCSQSSLWMMLIRPPGSYTVERHKQVFLTREKGFERKSHMEQQDKIHATAVNPTWRWFS